MTQRESWNGRTAWHLYATHRSWPDRLENLNQTARSSFAVAVAIDVLPLVHDQFTLLPAAVTHLSRALEGAIDGRPDRLYSDDLELLERVREIVDRADAEAGTFEACEAGLNALACVAGINPEGYRSAAFSAYWARVQRTAEASPANVDSRRFESVIIRRREVQCGLAVQDRLLSSIETAGSLSIVELDALRQDMRHSCPFPDLEFERVVVDAAIVSLRTWKAPRATDFLGSALLDRAEIELSLGDAPAVRRSLQEARGSLGPSQTSDMTRLESLADRLGMF